MGVYADGEHDMGLCSVDMRNMGMHCEHVYSVDVTGIFMLQRGFSSAEKSNIWCPFKEKNDFLWYATETVEKIKWVSFWLKVFLTTLPTLASRKPISIDTTLDFMLDLVRHTQ
jgi:hypothetical protein